MRVSRFVFMCLAFFVVSAFVSGASLKTFNFDRNRDGAFAGEQDIQYWTAGYEYGLIRPETLLYIADTVPRSGTLKCLSDQVSDCFSVPLYTTDVAATRQGTLFVLRAFGFSDIPPAKSSSSAP